MILLLSTKVGDFFVVWEAYQWWLEDSEHSTIARIEVGDITKIQQIESIDELVDIGIVKNISWGTSKEDAIENALDCSLYEKEEEQELINKLIANVYKVGETYFIPNYND